MEERQTGFAGTIVRAITVFNVCFLAAAVLAVLAGALDPPSGAQTSLAIPTLILWSWVAVLPVTLVTALVLNRKSRWGWARQVNLAIVLLWTASVAVAGTGQI